jgi:hypothetical protein
MNLKLAWKIGEIFAVAASRAKRTWTQKPGGALPRLVNSVLGLAFFGVFAVAAYWFLASLKVPPEYVALYFTQFLFFIPAATAFFCFMYGLMFELNQSAYSVSLDMINWLPISSAEYVLGSTLATLYFCVAMLGVIYGAALGVGLYCGSAAAWALTLVVGVLSAFMGSFSVEIARAVLNRASSGLSKRGARTAIVGRIALTVLLLVIFSSVFNYKVLLQLSAWFYAAAGAAWFVPFLWPSLTIFSYLTGDLAGLALYGGLSFALTAAFMALGAWTRGRNWVQEEASISFGGKSRPLAGGGIAGFTGAESAIIRKDLKGLMRRREMASFLAFPFLMLVVNLINMNVADVLSEAAPLWSRLSFFSAPGMGVMFLAYYVAVTSIGQEGGAFVNLRASPLTPRELTRAKLIFSLVPAYAFTAVLLAAAMLIVRMSPEVFLMVSVFAVAAISAAASIGLAVGARFADFTEIPRARFITPVGAIIGVLAVFAAEAAIYAPIPLIGSLGLGHLYEFTAAAVVAAVGGPIIYASYRLAVTEVEKVYDSAPV